MKSIITVNGQADVHTCQMVLSHEHLFIDLTNQASPEASTAPVAPAHRQQLLTDPYSMRDNLLLSDFETACEEGKKLLAAGCDTIVDCTTSEIGRDPQLLKKLADHTGLKIVAGCAWYTGDTHSQETIRSSAAHLAEALEREICEGIGSTGIKPGVIGEIGTGKEILPTEWKALEAAAEVQKKCGLALQIHIYPWSTNGLQVVDFLESRGVDPARIVICHSDIAPDYNYMTALLKRGVWLQMDNFGKEFTPSPGGFADGDFARDELRAEIAARIIQDGFGSQLLLTNDICLKCMLSRYGGRGYSHVLTDILPMISQYGIPGEYLRQEIMRRNPLDMLAGR